MSPGKNPAQQVEAGNSALVLPARSISRPVREFVQVPRQGNVLATFQRSCYLEFEGRIVALVAPELRNGPLNIILEVPPAYSFQPIPLGGPACAKQQELIVETVMRVSLVGATVWEPTIAPWATQPDELVAALALCRKLLSREAPAASFANVLPTAMAVPGTYMEEALFNEARAAIHRLAEGIQSNDLSALAEGTRRLAGLGLGLTPSGDDVLVGVLLALAVCPSPMTEAFWATILSAAAGRSPRISAAYLDAATRHEASEVWHRFLKVLPTGDSEAVTSAMRAVMATGETSGADTLAGFLLTLQPG